MRIRSHLSLVTAILLVVCTGLILYCHAGRVLLNLGYVDLATAWFVENGAARPVRRLQQALAAGEPAANWGLGWAALRRGDATAQEAAWRLELAASPARLPLYRVMWTEQRQWAELAHRLYPDEPLATFWLAEIVAGEDALAAIPLYTKGLAQAPRADRAWYALAQLYERTDQSQQAFVAYVQACYHGDPGFNACLLAGRQAEEMDRIDWAIELYGRSLWAPARQQAVRLQAAQSTP